MCGGNSENKLTDDDQALKGKADAATDSSRRILGSILCLEDLGTNLQGASTKHLPVVTAKPYHVPYTVHYEREGGRDCALSTPREVARDQGPAEEH